MAVVILMAAMKPARNAGSERRPGCTVVGFARDCGNIGCVAVVKRGWPDCGSPVTREGSSPAISQFG